MTALRAQVDGFGYGPARAARLESERALRRALPASFAVVAGAIGALLLAARMIGVSAPEPAAVRGPVRWVLHVPQLEPGAVAVARPSAPRSGGVPRVPMPDVQASAPTVPLQGAPGLTGAAGSPQPGFAEGTPSGADGEEGGMPRPGDVFLGDQLPARVSCAPPVYPDMARDAGVEGTVTLWALVDLDGSVREVRIIRSVPLLDDVAASAVRGWRFTPALTNGHPVRVWIAVPVRFSLR